MPNFVCVPLSYTLGADYNAVHAYIAKSFKTNDQHMITTNFF